MITFYAGVKNLEHRAPNNANVKQEHLNTYRFYHLIRNHFEQIVAANMAYIDEQVGAESDKNIVVVCPTILVRDVFRSLRPDWVVVTSALFLRPEVPILKHSIVFCVCLRDLHNVLTHAASFYPEIHCGIDNIEAVLRTHYKVAHGPYGQQYKTLIRQFDETS